MMRWRSPVTAAMTWRCSWCARCSACSPMTPASSSRATSSSTCWRPGPREDGSDLGPALARLFQVLNTPVDQRQAKLDEDLARFPYVNGDLFAARLTIPDFDAAMRSALIDACRFDWAAISPAIFGALFQSVMNAAERRAQGAHYTTEKNILKVIGPLFLDDLRAEFNRLRARKDKRRRGELTAFQKRLGGMKFFDSGLWLRQFPDHRLPGIARTGNRADPGITSRQGR